MELLAKDLQKENEFKEKQQTIIYEDILKKANAKIKLTHDIHKKTNCVFTLPQIVYGQPRYDTESCIIFLMYKLRANGFRVKQKSKDSIKINWKPKNTNKEKKIQSFADESVSKKEKEKKKKKEKEITPPWEKPKAFNLDTAFDKLAARAELIRQFENNES